MEKGDFRFSDAFDFKIKGKTYAEDPKYTGKVKKKDYETDSKGYTFNHTIRSINTNLLL
jgi:hypothetical protein